MCGNPGAHSPGAKNCNFIYVLHVNTLPNDIGHGAITKDFQLSIRNWQSEIQGHNAADSSRPGMNSAILRRREKCPENRTGACRLMWGEDGNGTRLITLIQC